MDHLKLRRLSKKELFDIRTMRWFIPDSAGTVEITEEDEIMMADLSSRGTKPPRKTTGLTYLQWGKTYRDLTITDWKRDVGEGLITKGEIYESVPEWLLPWVKSKLVDTPYDVEGSTTTLLVDLYRRGMDDPNE